MPKGCGRCRCSLEALWKKGLDCQGAALSVAGEQSDIEGKIQWVFDGFKASLIAFRLTVINNKEFVFVDK